MNLAVLNFLQKEFEKHSNSEDPSIIRKYLNDDISYLNPKVKLVDIDETLKWLKSYNVIRLTSSSVTLLKPHDLDEWVRKLQKRDAPDLTN